VGHAAKVRQLTGPLSSWPYWSDAAWDALVELLRETRPWTAEPAVAKHLEAWAAGDVGLPECLDVAAELAGIGRLPDQRASSATALAALTFDMLHNVQLRRPPWELGSLGDVPSLPARTRRRHRAEGIAYHRQRTRRKRNLRELMQGGRSESAARRWLQRHPGQGPRDAPPPRRVRRAT
jgi:hypothetical protein